jgi:hypothetical protein
MRSPVSALYLIIALGGALVGACGEARPEHILVSEEVLLEPGKLAAHASAIAKTPDGGYVLAGLIESQPWATKVDGHGKPLWRHTLGEPGEFALGGGTTYSGIAVLKSGIIVLCGTLELQDANRHITDVSAVLTRLDPSGRMLSVSRLHAAAVPTPHVASLETCVATPTGGLAVGTTSRDRVQSYWLVNLNDAGEVVSEKVIPMLSGRDGESGLIRGIAQSPAGDLLLFDAGATAIRISPQGSAKARGPFGVPLMPMAGPMEPVRSIPPRGDLEITVFNGNFVRVQTITTKSEGLHRLLAYSLPDGTLAIFGEEERGSIGTAAVGWIDPAHRRAESLVFKPTYGSVWVDAAVPTGAPGEFAAVRSLVAGMHHTNGASDEDRSGVLLMFIRFR